MEPHYEMIRKLYMEKLSGVISEADESRLAHLLRSDPEAHEIWQTLEKEGSELGAAGFLAGLEPKSALIQVKRRNAAKRLLSKRPIWRYAAAAAVLIVAFFIFRFREQTAPIEFPVVAMSTDGVQLRTQDGRTIDLSTSAEGGVYSLDGMEIRIDEEGLQSVNAEKAVMSTLTVPPTLSYRVVLSDGTKVWLNSGSELRFPSQFTGSTREVTLAGEGYFEVVKNPQRPFIVHAGDTEIEVLGTQFNVSSYRTEPVRTALVEGSVKVSAENEPPITLRPGFMSEFDGTGFRQVTFDTSEITGWINGIYYFNNASLDELAPVINRWYGVSVKLEDGRLTRHRISGLLERGQVAHFLSDLHSSTGISSRIEGETLIFFN